MSPPDGSRLSMHQRRVLAALEALETAHGWRWWTRAAIGAVVGAGGYHGVIQIKTMALLKDRGLVQTEFAAWPAEVRELVRCGCATYHWGLTEAGRAAAAALNIVWPAAALERLRWARFHSCHTWRFGDEDEPPQGFDEDDDDDGGDRDPAPVGPGLVPAGA